LLNRLPHCAQNDRRALADELYHRMFSSPDHVAWERSTASIAKKFPWSFWQSPQWHATTPTESAGTVTEMAPQ
jgi:hypothetical protein